MNQKLELELNKQELEQVAAGSQNLKCDTEALKSDIQIETTVSNNRRSRGDMRAQRPHD